jgi:hypothetical protein
MFVERNQGIYQSSFVVLMLHIVYSIVAVLQVWYCVNLLVAKLFIHKPSISPDYGIETIQKANSAKKA